MMSIRSRSLRPKVLETYEALLEDHEIQQHLARHCGKFRTLSDIFERGPNLSRSTRALTHKSFVALVTLARTLQDCYLGKLSVRQLTVLHLCCWIAAYRKILRRGSDC